MKRIEPYYADDTDGVFFEVCINGVFIVAHVGRQVLLDRYGAPAHEDDWVAVYRAHRCEIDQAARGCACAITAENVILCFEDFGQADGR